MQDLTVTTEKIAMDLLRRDRLDAWEIISTGEIVEPADA